MPYCARLPQFLDSSVDRVQRVMGSATLILGSILVVALVRFALVASV